MSTDGANSSVEIDQDSELNIKPDVGANSDANQGVSSSSTPTKPEPAPNFTDQNLGPELNSNSQPNLMSAANINTANSQPTLANNKNNILEAIEEFDSSKAEAQSKISRTEDLFSSKRWGVTPIRQDTPWELPPSPSPTQASTTNNFGSGDSMGANSLANSLGHMHLGGGGASGMHQGSRGAFDQPWRSPAATKPHQPSMVPSAAFANNLINSAPGGMQKSMLNSVNRGGSGNGAGGNGGSSAFASMQQSEFARAPGPASSMMDNNMTPKPFGMANRSSTWSAFGAPVPNEPETEWPKTTASGISTNNSTQPTNAFDLVPEFEPGKLWRGSMLMNSIEDDSTINSSSTGMSSFAGAYASTSKSPTGSHYEPSGIGTWSPIVKGARPGSKWDGDGPDNGHGDNGRFDDGTAIWGSPAQSKVAGVDWVDKTGESNSNSDKSRSMAGNNQSYRPQQTSSSTSLLMSSNTSPSTQHNRSPQVMKQPSLSQNFDQVQPQSNALPSQASQPNRGLGLSSNVPQTQQLKHMVQQIQLAVQAGHLNPQILNQHLSPVTLQLLYQLLQQIKVLQQLQMQASTQFNKPGNPVTAVNVHITKTKQQILNLQNQIAAQQALYLKQTQAHNISTRQPTMPSLATGGVSAGIGPTLPPGISQTGDSFRSGGSVNDFHAPAMVNNFGSGDSMGANSLANSLGHMHLGGGGASGMHQGSRGAFDQPWRSPAATKPHQPSMVPSAAFANNLINSAPGGMQKSMLNSGNGGGGNGGSSAFASMQQSEFARAPGPASSMMDNNMTPKPFGMANRSSTWSAFGAPVPNEPETEWPKTTASGISTNNSTQPTNAFDLVPEFEPGKPWRGSMLMKSVEDDPTMTPGSMARSLAPQRKTIWSDDLI